MRTYYFKVTIISEHCRFFRTSRVHHNHGFLRPDAKQRTESGLIKVICNLRGDVLLPLLANHPIDNFIAQ